MVCRNRHRTRRDMHWIWRWEIRYTPLMYFYGWRGFLEALVLGMRDASRKGPVG